MIAENVKNIEENVKKICFRLGRSPDSVRLIAVSKTFSVKKIEEVIQANVVDLGENYVQELKEKHKSLDKPGIRWHFIGHLQSNKVKYIAEWIHMIHSVDSEDLAKEIDKYAKKIGRVIDVLVEVNTSEEATKFGIKPNFAFDVLKKIAVLSNINIKGLMTIGPFTEEKEESRKAFRILTAIFKSANDEKITREPLVDLSMGMTHDYEIAIEEGSTMIRIGTAIFGTRTKQTQ